LFDQWIPRARHFFVWKMKYEKCGRKKTKISWRNTLKTTRQKAAKAAERQRRAEEARCQEEEAKRRVEEQRAREEQEEEKRKEEKEKMKHSVKRHGGWIDILPPVEKKTRKRMATEQLTGPHKMHNMGPDWSAVPVG